MLKTCFYVPLFIFACIHKKFTSQYSNLLTLQLILCVIEMLRIFRLTTPTCFFIWADAYWNQYSNFSMLCSDFRAVRLSNFTRIRFHYFGRRYRCSVFLRFFRFFFLLSFFFFLRIFYLSINFRWFRLFDCFESYFCLFLLFFFAFNCMHSGFKIMCLFLKFIFRFSSIFLWLHPIL